MNIWNTFLGQIQTIRFADVVDILAVTVLIYYIIRLVRETHAATLIKGLIAILVAYLVSYFFGLKTINFLIRNLFQIGALALVILFQPELRRILEHLGRTRVASLLNFAGLWNDEKSQEQWKKCIRASVDACSVMSAQKTGALMVFERQTPLSEVITTGTTISAEPSNELINNIFFHNSPLHDGAMIIRNGMLYAAGCFLPLSENFTISREFGTRHRAALGISEVSDAIVVVCSEETGLITIAENGEIRHGVTPQELEKTLNDAFLVDPRKKNNEPEQPAALAEPKEEKADEEA